MYKNIFHSFTLLFIALKLALTPLFCADIQPGPSAAEINNFYTHTVRPSIIYKKAELTDLNELMQIIEAIDEEDQDNLVILPAPYQRLSLQAALEKGRIFIACDTNRLLGDSIVSFIKLFNVKNLDEKMQILQHELRAFTSEKYGTPTTSSLTLYSGLFNTDKAYNQMYQFDHNLNTTPLRLTKRNQAAFKSTKDIEKTTLVYIGSQYTIKTKQGYGLLEDSTISYRGLGISTKLEKRAFQLSFLDILNTIRTNQSDKFAVAYGLVHKNENTLVHIRDSMCTAQYLKGALNPAFNTNSIISMHYYKYDCFKPAFMLTRRRLIQLNDSHPTTLAGAGFGCILTATLRT